MSYTPAELGYITDAKAKASERAARERRDRELRRSGKYRPGDRVFVDAGATLGREWCRVIELLDGARVRVRFPSGGNLIVPVAMCEESTRVETDRPESTKVGDHDQG